MWWAEAAAWAATASVGWMLCCKKKAAAAAPDGKESEADGKGKSDVEKSVDKGKGAKSTTRAARASRKSRIRSLFKKADKKKADKKSEKSDDSDKDTEKTTDLTDGSRMGKVREMLLGKETAGTPGAFRRSIAASRRVSRRSTEGRKRRRKRQDDDVEEEEGPKGPMAAGRWRGLPDGLQLCDDVKVLRDPKDTAGPPSVALRSTPDDKENRKVEAKTRLLNFAADFHKNHADATDKSRHH